MRSLSLRPEERPERVEWLSEQLQVGLCTKSDAGERSAEIGSDLPSDTYGETPPASDGFAAPRELSVPAHDLTQRVQRMPRHISRSVTDGLARVPSWALRGSAAALVAVASLGAIGWLLASRPAIAPARALLPTPAAPSSEAPHAGTDRATPQAAGATTQAPAPSPESRPPTGARTQTGTRSPTSLADPPEPSVASAADAGPGLRSDTQELARRRFPGGSNAASAPKEPSDPDPRVASWTPDAAPTSPAPASAGAGTQGSVVSGLGTPDSASGGRDAPGRGPDPGDGLVELTIRSNVRGDTLEIDGEFVGSTERRTLRLTPGRHTLRISKTGYATEERTVLLRPDAPDQEVNVVLTRTVSPDARRLRRALSELDASDLDVRIAAIAEIETSAQRGDARAQRVLGRLYARGEDVPRDERLALSWYRKAAHAGSARAQHELALRLEYGRWDPLGAGALEAAPQEGRLQRLLGWFTDDGERRNRKRELARAFLQRLEGNRGDEFGGPRLTGDPQDFPEAFTWYTKAAEQGVGAAQERAAFMMAAGRGTSQNLITAFRRWFMRAAENGQRDSQYVVGMCYLLDVGIGRHPTNAAAGECWLRRAAAQGQPDARVELESRGIDPDLRPPAACRVDYLP